jgi:hypothetical protein
MRGGGPFTLTKGQAASLARALRTTPWEESLGDYSATLTHPSGAEVTITVYAPRPAPTTKAPIGFRWEE